MIRVRDLHPWRVSSRKAIEIQSRLRAQVRIERLPVMIRYVAGVDVASSKRTDAVWAGVAVFSCPELVAVEERWFHGESDFPYVPGLLSFREIPVLLKALECLETDPDVILCDAQGIAHPRGFGLASHLGLVVDKPTVGCAKSRLVGDFSEVGGEKGRYAYLWYENRIVGAAARTRSGVKPVFVSPGHRVSLEDSLRVVFGCCKKYRVPEPIRSAHALVNRVRKREEP